VAGLVRVRALNAEMRFYRNKVWPDPFGRAILAALGADWQIRLSLRLGPHPDPGAAINALAPSVRRQAARGYWDQAALAAGRLKNPRRRE
jgi:hypothetical protein